METTLRADLTSPRLTLATPTAQTASTTPTARTPLCIAHRGASDLAPENTLSAVRAAVAARADLVEVDVQRTRDHVLVLMHDATLTRTTDAAQVFPDRAPWWLGDFTLAELQRLDAGSWCSPAHAGEPVPTLQDVLDLLDANGTGLLLELKDPADHRGVVAELADELAARRTAAYLRNAATDVLVQSFDHEAMRLLKAYDHRLDVGLIGKPRRDELPQLGAWVAAVNPHHYAVDAGYVAAVQAAGMRCMPWTVNTATSVRRATRMGVDGIITDRPQLLRGG